MRHLSCVKCHVSYVMRHVSCITCPWRPAGLHQYLPLAKIPKYLLNSVSQKSNKYLPFPHKQKSIYRVNISLLYLFLGIPSNTRYTESTGRPSCHVSHFTCHGQVLHVNCPYFGGSVINGATPSSFRQALVTDECTVMK